MNASFGSRKFARLLVPCAAVGAVLAADVAGAAALIVRSSGPSAPTYKPGKALPDNAKVALKPGDSLTVLATNSTRTFRGPGTFALAGGGGPATAVIAGRRGRFSSNRGPGVVTAGIVPRSPTLWHVDVSQSGKVCVADPARLELWRPNASKAATLKVTRADGTSETLSWPAGEAILPWPASVPVASGAQYQLSVEGEQPAKLTFATLPTLPTDPTSVAQALIDAQCQNQLDLLIETLPDATSTS